MYIYYIYSSEIETFMYEEHTLTMATVHSAQNRDSHIVSCQYVFVKKSSKQSGDRSVQNTVAGEVDFEPRYVDPPQLCSQFASISNSVAAGAPEL